MAIPLPRPRAYLKRSCPFCLKLRIFLTEAGMTDGLDYVVFDDGDDVHQRVRATMQAAGQDPAFPTVEFEEGRFETGTDDLIARFAASSQVNADNLPLLRYYSEGVFKRYREMFQQLRDQKG
ncbi:MAG TPA: hypothetical protein VJM09_06935 [Sphingobium sp.]|nr:hypothetical protein [Sphingobium sp.]